MPPYIIYALPRSRTYWLSRFLTYGAWSCGHDEILHLRSMDDVASWLSQPCTGTVETNAASFWRLVPNLKTVVIRRPVEEVVESTIKTGLPVGEPSGFTRHIQRLDYKLDQIVARVPNVLIVTFDELKTEEGCQKVFEFCLPYQHDQTWWNYMAPINLQVNIHHTLKYFTAHLPQLNKLAKIAKHKIIASMSHALADIEHEDGFVFREEKMKAMFDDARRLFADHCVVVGEEPDAYMHKNLELIQRLEDIDALQIMTARENGRIYGYLVSILCPSMDSPDVKVATQTMFYTDPAMPGLGRRLQRAAIERLREKGVGEAYFHAGVRGSGPRMGSLYQRIGAQPHGNWYKLLLEP